jgi:hypothetical protein
MRKARTRQDYENVSILPGTRLLHIDYKLKAANQQLALVQFFIPQLSIRKIVITLSLDSWLRP